MTRMSLLDGNQEVQGNPVHSNGDWLIEPKTIPEAGSNQYTMM